MRIIKLFAAAAMLAACTTASAQSSSAKGVSETTHSTDGWNTVWLQYNPTRVSVDYDGTESMKATAFSIGYSRAFSVSSNIPLFVEGGAGLQYSWSKDGSEDDIDVKTSVLSVKIPADILYKFQIPNSPVTIAPYAGINLRFNVWGEQKYKYRNYEKSFNLFDKDNWEDEDEVWNRFQIGWHAGVKACFLKTYTVGVGYGSDFSELYKKAKVGEWTLQLGYTF